MLPDPKTETKTVLFSGHMTDAPGRETPRFPGEKEARARVAIDAALLAWDIGPGCACICGGARGGDILFAEAARDLGASVRVFLPLPVDDFLEASVRTDSADTARWEARFETMVRHAEEVHILTPDAPWPGRNVFDRNNARMLAHVLEVARNSAEGPDICVLLLWDGKSGDGPGGTADLAKAAREADARLHIISPHDL